MTERGLSIRSEYNYQGWETADFPIVCETCMGNNPFVRMMKDPHGKACEICGRPFTCFRWKPGTSARYKKTVICQTCAKQKNVCQVCIFDLEYGLPVEVRDRLASEVSETGGTIPAEVMRKSPYYKRNEAKLCSFFARGECKRGAECPYRHEMPRDKDDPLRVQRVKDRYYGENDPLAAKIIGKLKSKSSLEKPIDRTVKTLWVGGLTPEISEEDIRNNFYAYGEITSLKIVPRQQCAFVEYLTREQCDLAADTLNNNLIINGQKLRIRYAAKLKSGDATQSGAVAPTVAVPFLALTPAGMGAPPPMPPSSSPPPPKAEVSMKE